MRLRRSQLVDAGWYLNDGRAKQKQMWFCVAPLGETAKPCTTSLRQTELSSSTCYFVDNLLFCSQVQCEIEFDAANNGGGDYLEDYRDSVWLRVLPMHAIPNSSSTTAEDSVIANSLL